MIHNIAALAVSFSAWTVPDKLAVAQEALSNDRKVDGSNPVSFQFVLCKTLSSHCLVPMGADVGWWWQVQIGCHASVSRLQGSIGLHM